MTMHILPIYYNTNNIKKRKKRKLSQREISARLQHEKFLRKMGVNSRSSAGSEQRSSKPWVAGSSPAESTTPKTSDKIPTNCFAKPRQQYSGTKIIGIATMHKSNIVPISNKKDAEDVSKMRRN